jgi:hypothetical protein
MRNTNYRQVIKTTANTGFASGGVTCKLGTLCFYSSSVQVDSFVLRFPARRKAPKRWWQPYLKIGKFNNLMQQMIKIIFVELWKNHVND